MNDEMERLALEAQALDEEMKPAALAAEPAEPIAAPQDEALEVIRFGVALFVPIYPSLGNVYTEDRQARLAAVASPLMAKYGITMGGIFAQWGPEINFLIVAGPLAIETAKAIRADKTPAKSEEKPLKAQHETEQQGQ